MGCKGCGQKFRNLTKQVPTNSVSVTQPLTHPAFPPVPRVRSNRGAVRQQLVVPPPAPSTETKS